MAKQTTNERITDGKGITKSECRHLGSLAVIFVNRSSFAIDHS